MQIDLYIYVVEKHGPGLDAVDLGREFLRLTRANEQWVSERLDLSILLGLTGRHWGLVVGPKGKDPRLPLIRGCFPDVISVRYRLYTTLEGAWAHGREAWKESQQIFPA